MSMLTKVRGQVPWTGIRRLGARLTTPLDPDDYLALINPLWTARELRGRSRRSSRRPTRRDPRDPARLGLAFDHQPGQYIGIGSRSTASFHWRSLLAVVGAAQARGPHHRITVKAMPEGFMSEHLVNGLEPGTIVRLALPRATSSCPTRRRSKMLFLVGGSGITPVMSMLRTLDAAGGTMPDVVLALLGRRRRTA